ncbi:MAG: carbon storage regulator [Planctomycetia bacterium]|nr:carbon storage regulator [Planctomycetia bacterium]
MLVLSRKESERIRVGDSIVVTVVRLTKDRVRLGIEAPDDVLVLRDELEKEPESCFAGASGAAFEETPKKRVPVQTTLAQKRRQAMAQSATSVSEEQEEESAPPSERKAPSRPFFRF